jgi:hypothetical protein
MMGWPKSVPLTEDERREELLKILQGVIKRDERIALLERIIYECVSYRDIYNSTALTEELYNEITEKFETETKTKTRRRNRVNASTLKTTVNHGSLRALLPT